MTKGDVVKKVTVTYSRSHLSELLDRVQTGKEIVISRRGKNVARLLPTLPKTPKEPVPLKELAEFRSKMPQLRKSSTVLLREMRDGNG